MRGFALWSDLSGVPAIHRAEVAQRGVLVNLVFMGALGTSPRGHDDSLKFETFNSSVKRY
jgi:hypothetical protein